MLCLHKVLTHGGNLWRGGVPTLAGPDPGGHAPPQPPPQAPASLARATLRRTASTAVGWIIWTVTDVRSTRYFHPICYSTLSALKKLWTYPDELVVIYS